MALPAWLGALFLIGVGLGVLAVARHGWRTGELPAGASLLRRYRPRRDEEPGSFHFFFLLYVGSGIAAILYGVAMAFGAAAPLPLR
jgi:hypothetical protein